MAIAGYDNLKPILTELDPILALTTEYSLTFSTSEASDAVIRRSIAMNFTADSYQRAKTVLRKLHDSACRCMLERLSLSFTGGADDPVNVNGTIVFFEYRPPEQAPSEDADA